MADLTTIIHNERLKLAATFLNGLGIALFAVGGLAPVFSNLYGPNPPGFLLIFVSVICFASAFALHYAGSRLLKDLRE